MSSGSAPTAISTQVQFRLMVSGERQAVVPTVLDYCADEPYAVRATFHTGEEGVTWVFARDLLAEGSEVPVGSGDVSVWPAREGTSDVVCLSLSSPSGQALLQADVTDIRGFLERTYAAVARGSEADRLDIDGLIEHILTENPAEF